MERWRARVGTLDGDIHELAGIPQQHSISTNGCHGRNLALSHNPAQVIQGNWQRSVFPRELSTQRGGDLEPQHQGMVCTFICVHVPACLNVRKARGQYQVSILATLLFLEARSFTEPEAH